MKEPILSYYDDYFILETDYDRVTPDSQFCQEFEGSIEKSPFFYMGHLGLGEKLKNVNWQSINNLDEVIAKGVKLDAFQQIFQPKEDL